MRVQSWRRWFQVHRDVNVMEVVVAVVVVEEHLMMSWSRRTKVKYQELEESLSTR